MLLVTIELNFYLPIMARLYRNLCHSFVELNVIDNYCIECY